MSCPFLLMDRKDQTGVVRQQEFLLLDDAGWLAPGPVEPAGRARQEASSERAIVVDGLGPRFDKPGTAKERGKTCRHGGKSTQCWQAEQKPRPGRLRAGAKDYLKGSRGK